MRSHRGFRSYHARLGALSEKAGQYRDRGYDHHQSGGSDHLLSLRCRQLTLKKPATTARLCRRGDEIRRLAVRPLLGLAISADVKEMQSAVAAGRHGDG